MMQQQPLYRLRADRLKAVLRQDLPRARQITYQTCINTKLGATYFLVSYNFPHDCYEARIAAGKNGTVTMYVSDTLYQHVVHLVRLKLGITYVTGIKPASAIDREKKLRQLLDPLTVLNAPDISTMLKRLRS